ncbi:MAG: dihydrofolate reductase, partial [Actinomycetota bacterium]|nr:dihydrofolate reductase [Actinomycetota bacterium]
MATVIMHAVVSVDGYIADDNDEVGPLFEWYFNGDVPLVEDPEGNAHGPFAVSKASYAYTRPMWDRIRVIIQGRHLFDLTNGWEASPPTGEHLVVVSH